MEEIIIDVGETLTGKRKVNLCVTRDDGSLSIIGTVKLNVTSNFVNGTDTTTYKRKTFVVKGNIYTSYIIIG